MSQTNELKDIVDMTGFDEELEKFNSPTENVPKVVDDESDGDDNDNDSDNDSQESLPPPPKTIDHNPFKTKNSLKSSQIIGEDNDQDKKVEQTEETPQQPDNHYQPPKKMFWLYEGRGGGWWLFDKNDQIHLENARIMGLKSINLNKPRMKITVHLNDYKDMYQESSNGKRKIIAVEDYTDLQVKNR